MYSGQRAGHRGDHPGQQLADRAGLDQPVHRGDGQPLRLDIHHARACMELALPQFPVRAERLYVAGGVEVHPEEVQRLPDDVEVAVLDQAVDGGGGVVRVVGQQLRVAAVEQRLEEDAVVPRLVQRRGIGRLRGHRPDDRQVQGDPGVGRPGPRRTQRAQRLPVRQQQVVVGRDGLGGVADTGRVPPVPVADRRDHPRLVQRDPLAHPVAERVARDGRELGEPVRAVPARPAARVLQGLRQVPVVQRHGRADARLEQGVEHPAVVIQPLRVHRAAAGRLDPRPGQA